MVLAHRDAVDTEERLGPLDRVAHGAPRLVDRRRLLERRPPLAGAGLRVSVGMQRARQLAMRLLDDREIEIEAPRQAEHGKRIEHG